MSVLGLSWAILVSILESKIINNHWFSTVFVDNHFFDRDKVYNRVLDQAWVDLGSERVQHECQNGSNMDPNMIPNSINKYDENLIDFGLRQGGP